MTWRASSLNIDGKPAHAMLNDRFAQAPPCAHMDRVLPELKTMHPEYRLEYDQIDDLKWAQYRKWLRWIGHAH